MRVIAPDVGGGFGGKGLDVEDLLVGALARATGRPVRWTETRSEHMVSMPHGRAQWIDFEMGGDQDGTVKALRLKILQDAGAYPSLGAFLANLTMMMSSGVYAIPKIEVDVTAVATNSMWSVRCAARDGPRRRSCWSARWTCSPPRSGSIPPRCGGATSSPPTRSRTRPPSALATTSATTPARWNWHWSTPVTSSSGATRSSAGARGQHSSSASA